MSKLYTCDGCGDTTSELWEPPYCTAECRDDFGEVASDTFTFMVTITVPIQIDRDSAAIYLKQAIEDSVLSGSGVKSNIKVDQM
jgi:hypothetical protein